jgi:hypothetical protein
MERMAPPLAIQMNKVSCSKEGGTAKAAAKATSGAAIMT